MTAEILVLRLVHVLGGIFWVGSGLFSAFFLIPALMQAGPAAGQIMGNLQQRKMFVVMPTVALLTILSGVRLMWIFSGGFASRYFATATGRTLGIGGAAAIAAFLLGVFVSRPLGARSGALRAQVAAATDDAARGRLTAEIEGLQRRTTLVGVLTTVLLLLAAASMAVARYL